MRQLQPQIYLNYRPLSKLSMDLKVMPRSQKGHKLAVYKIVDPHNYLLITLDGKLLRGLFEHDRLKPAVIRTNQGNVTNLSKLKQVMSSGLLIP